MFYKPSPRGQTLNTMACKVALAVGCATLPTSAPAAGLSPDAILETASSYTVKIRRSGTIGLNEDSGASAHATGFLVDRMRGWILTNAHVASRSPAKLSVSFKGQPYVPARRVFVDRLTDVAVLAIDAGVVPAGAMQAILDCDQRPRTGTSVVIFGHPGDLSYTATRGIISSVPWIFPTEVIQSDASVNAGNSGGPMIDIETGKVVGIAAATYRDTEDEYSTAVSLSEPIPPACRIINLLKSGQDARYRSLPVAYAVGEDDDQPIVAAVFKSSSGLKIGDRILAINDTREIRNISDVAVALRGEVQPVTVSVIRGGRKTTLTVATEAMPDVLSTRSLDLSGLVISEQWQLDSAELDHERFPIIDFVRPGTPADDTKAQPGYYVASVNEQSFTSLEKLQAYLRGLPAGSAVRLILKAPSDAKAFHRKYHFVTLPLENLDWIQAEQVSQDRAKGRLSA